MNELLIRYIERHYQVISDRIFEINCEQKFCHEIQDEMVKIFVCNRHLTYKIIKEFAYNNGITNDTWYLSSAPKLDVTIESDMLKSNIHSKYVLQDLIGSLIRKPCLKRIHTCLNKCKTYNELLGIMFNNGYMYIPDKYVFGRYNETGHFHLIRYIESEPTRLEIKQL